MAAAVATAPTIPTVPVDQAPIPERLPDKPRDRTHRSHRSHGSSSHSSRVKCTQPIKNTEQSVPAQTIVTTVTIEGIVIKTDISKHYTFGKRIGKGASCYVYKGQHIESKRNVAIKKIFRSYIEKVTDDGVVQLNKHFIQEITVLKLCKHPHIVEYIDLYIDDNCVYIVMEYLDGEELFDYVSGQEDDDMLPLEKVRDIFVQIISAVEFCHGNLIAHRDLKLENIMIDKNGKVKLIDFGLSAVIDTENATTTRCGSPNYVAPEVLMDNGSPYNPLQTDIWSIGVILYMLASCCSPWSEQDNDKMLYKDIVNCDWLPNNDIPDVVNETIKKILVKVDKRITLQELKKEKWLEPYCLKSGLPEFEAHTEIILLLVDKIITLGYDKSEVLLSIYDNKNNAINNIYRMLLTRHLETGANYNRIRKDKTRATASHSELYRRSSNISAATS